MKGLTSSQIPRLLNQYGLNSLTGQKQKSIYVKLFERFKDFLTILLIIAAIFSFIIGETVDGTLIVLIVVLNAFFGLYQEAKAEESLKVLKEMTVTRIRVIRDGKETEIDSVFLVPGDLVYLEEGVKVPADGVVLKSINLEIDESSLTGESFPVTKMEKEEIFSGTIVAKGRGYMKVLKTGNLTKFGLIAKDISLIKDEITPLQKKLVGLTRFIGIWGIILAITVFFVSFLEGFSYLSASKQIFSSFLLAVSLAVAVVPEGLPAVMTITMAIGIKKMAGKKTIVRKLSAIEALGSVTLIATDKTGTLTMNKMQVKEIHTDGERAKNLLILNGILCSTASLVYIHDHGGWDVLGDPTEGALLYLAQKLKVDIDEVRKNWQLIDEKPFDSVTKMMSVTACHPRSSRGSMDSRFRGNDRGGGNDITFSKGAPESILNVCDRILIGKTVEKLTKSQTEKIKQKIDDWAKKGLRVLAFSYNQNLQQSGSWNLDLGISQKNSVFLGMVAIHDEPRPEVNKAILKAKKAGIKIIMITGDNEKTAEAIGVSCGLISEGDEILTGNQLEEFNDRELKEILSKVKIFARTNPFQKHRIVLLYQQMGEIVAVTGDGVNDAIALKQADVGVAMGMVGTDVARETADIIITDDNFATIVTAIEEGRSIINSIKNAVKYLLACNVSEAVALLIGLAFGLPTLFFPIQLLYINLVTDGLPALMLSFSPRNSDLMTITPQKEIELLNNKDQVFIGAVGIFGSVLVIVAYFIFSAHKLGGTAAFTVLTLIQSFIFVDLWLSHKHIHKNLTHLISPLFIIGFLIPVVLQFFILSSHFIAGLFKVLPVTFPVYLEFIGFSALILTSIWGIKKAIEIK